MSKTVVVGHDTLFRDPNPLWQMPNYDGNRFGTEAIPVREESPPTTLDERVVKVSSTKSVHGIKYDKSQIYDMPKECNEQYVASKEKHLMINEKNSSPIAPPAPQAPIPVDAETLLFMADDNKRIKRVDGFKKELNEDDKMLQAAQLLDEPKLFSPNKRHKPKESSASQRRVILPPSPGKAPLSEEETPALVLSSNKKPTEVVLDDANSSDEVSNDSAVVSDVDEVAGADFEHQSPDVSFSSNDDASFHNTYQKKVESSSRSSGSSSSSSSDDEANPSGKFELSMDSGESSDEEVSSSDDIGQQQRRASARKRKTPDVYTDEDFPEKEEDEKKSTAKPPVIKVERQRHKPGVALLGEPSSKRRDLKTTESPPSISALSTIIKFKSYGKNLTKFYTVGWRQLVNWGIRYACTMEYASADRSIVTENPPATKPLMLDILSEAFMAYLFERPGNDDFPDGSVDAVVMKIQRLLYIYRMCEIINKNNKWTKIKLSDPYDWAAARDYTPTDSFFVKTDHIRAYVNMRIALYPLDYIIYRCRMAIIDIVTNPKDKRSLDDLCYKMQTYEPLALGFCNDWCVACQLADLNIFPKWKDFDFKFNKETIEEEGKL